uniref:Mei2-like C-terminal RNA recognition motif domain-containing protein n=1 Tax=Pyrodinium bahamense TaxID=73915 RepID=A0A7S0AEV1_9DINO
MEATGEERRYEISEAAGAASSHVPHEAGRQTVGAGRQRRVLTPPAPDEPSQPLPKSVRTLLVRNVPMAWGQEDLLAKWPPDGSYDYLYIPYNLSKDSPLGIAYINFVSYEDAAWFHKKWHGRFLSRQDGKHPLDIAVAKVQGYAPNLARIKKSEARMLAEAGFLPVLVDGKRRMEAHEVIAEWRRACSMSGSGACRRRFQ